MLFHRFHSRKRSLFRISSLLSPIILIGAGMARGAEEAPKPADPTAYEKQVRPLLKQFCYNCHGAQNPRAGIDLARYDQVAGLQKEQRVWRKAVTQLRDRAMPPPGAPQPTQEQRDLLTHWLAQTLDTVEESLLPKNPGRVLIHRLSRAEYNNTIRDLFGVDSRPADRFPADSGGGGGFDNNADTLFIPPVLMERYLEAAGDILNAAPSQRLFLVRPGKTLPKREAARKILDHFATRAYRRPVDRAETERLLRLFDQATRRGETFENATRFALKAVLVSPNFLFRVEADHPGTEAALLSDYELAGRLSYFLWSSLPDDTLFQLAAQKRLHDPKILEQQVRRMIESPKSRALAENFAGQWLRVRDLYSAMQPDPGRFPAYTPALRDAMVEETTEFFQSVLQDDSSLLRLLDADYTYLNEDLAKHYGIEGVTGPQMRRVSLADRKRGGLLTMASILTLTSYPQRTSPVLRGKWVLSEILGAPPPPPLPNAGSLSTDDKPQQGLTFRQRLEQHRSKPQCASCHSRMDPIGFGLENFDAIGRWRTEIGGQPVDSSGVMATGEKFSGPIELKRLLLERKEEFVRNLTEKMLSYALGRGIEPYDLPTVRKITTAVAKNNYRSSTLILEIARSYPFQYRKSE